MGHGSQYVCRVTVANRLRFYRTIKQAYTIIHNVRQHSFIFQETSAKKKTNIKDCFHQIVSAASLFTPLQEAMIRTNSFAPHSLDLATIHQRRSKSFHMPLQSKYMTPQYEDLSSIPAPMPMKQEKQEEEEKSKTSTKGKTTFFI